VLTVPRGALHSEGSANYVFRVADGRLRRTPVDVGIVSLSRAEIRSGIALNEKVVLNAMDNRELRDGLRVQMAP
jgi:HlyD family secretion protein